MAAALFFPLPHGLTWCVCPWAKMMTKMGDSLQDSWMMQKATKGHTQTKRINAGKTWVSMHIQIDLDFRNSSC